MAQVPNIQKWKDAKRYLEGLRGSIEADVVPLLSTLGGAPFAICREVHSYIDHLGHLFTGDAGVGKRFREYLKQIMKYIDDNYDIRANEVYEMYRCGSVHEFEPKVLVNDNKEYMAWLCYRGQRSSIIDIQGQKVGVKHLIPLMPSGSKIYYLPVSTSCLVGDLIKSIELFINSRQESDRVKAWNNAASVLSSPKKCKFVV